MLKGLKKQGISSLVHKKEGGYTHEAIEICFGREFRLEFLFGQEFKELRDRPAFFKAKWYAQEPKAVNNFIRNFEQTLTYREYPEPLKTLIKTNNPLERYLEELQRRIKPFRKFANAGSVDRICYGIIAYVLDMPRLINPLNPDNFT